jgi:hypothetical protein
MENTGSHYFTYDYDVKYTYNQNGKVSGLPRRTANEAKLRGRKFYWHSMVNESLPKDPNKEMEKRIRPIKPEKRFLFKVAFDRVTADELKKLKFALTLAFGGEKVYAHKLGHGKPIGYGSVKISVDDISAYVVDDDWHIVNGGLPEMNWTPNKTT